MNAYHAIMKYATFLPLPRLSLPATPFWHCHFFFKQCLAPKLKIILEYVDLWNYILYSNWVKNNLRYTDLWSENLELYCDFILNPVARILSHTDFFLVPKTVLVCRPISIPLQLRWKDFQPANTAPITLDFTSWWLLSFHSIISFTSIDAVTTLQQESL
jgi:hypothetical protein